MILPNSGAAKKQLVAVMYLWEAIAQSVSGTTARASVYALHICKWERLDTPLHLKILLRSLYTLRGSKGKGWGPDPHPWKITSGYMFA